MNPAYSLKIGNSEIIPTDIIEQLQSESPDTKDKAQRTLNEKLKETRVRIGTILKTDNVSFLIGAGVSIASGGVSLANIPKSLEEALVKNALKNLENGKDAEWIKLFYSAASMIGRQELSLETRQVLFDAKNEEEFKAIPINLEEYLSHLYMWLAGTGAFGESITIKKSDKEELFIPKHQLQCLINEITGILCVLLDLPASEKTNPLLVHRRFIKKVLTRPLNLRRANLFTLNYDTLLEQAADAEGAVLVDGFVGTLRRVFRPESYDLDFYFPAQTTEGRVHRFDRALHLYKLHGSLTWHKCNQDWDNPYGLYATFFDQKTQADTVLIYPSPLKYGQALGLPYSELFRRFGNAVVQPQSVLFTIGYGFGDEHVNALIRQALAIPSFTLVIVDPNPQSSFFLELQKNEDERVWIVKGWELGTFECFVKKLMPDLREEEIEAKVMKTYKALSQADRAKSIEEDR